MPWYVNMGIIIAVVVAVTTFLFFFASKAVAKKQTDDERETVNVSMNFLALFYAVFVVLVFVDVQSQHDQIQDNVVKEASILVDMYRTSSALPLFDKVGVANAVYEYAEHVITTELPLMRAGKDYALVPYIHSDKLWNALSTVSPKDYKELALYETMLRRLGELTDARFQRFTSVDGRTSPFIWTVLIYGAIITVVSLVMLSAKSSTSNLLLVSFTVSMLVLVLMLIYSLDRPFAGATGVPLDAFREVLNTVVR
ncbi:MAG: DUF4239 domain-containing protein [Verrucomicrobia bacterium]|nr:DUF4239 domain-containing protein [Verrucomicrobiota bacterium]MBS0637160.1 DUF4239 domain-containing protein [Verrucomicrobiota bacterium]